MTEYAKGSDSSGNRNDPKKGIESSKAWYFQDGWSIFRLQSDKNFVVGLACEYCGSELLFPRDSSLGLDVPALAVWLAGRKEADIVTKTASRVIVPSIMDDTLEALRLAGKWPSRNKADGNSPESHCRGNVDAHARCAAHQS